MEIMLIGIINHVEALMESTGERGLHDKLVQ